MPDAIARIMSRFANLALTGDGLPEIETLHYLPFESSFPAPTSAQRLALVLVEPRLLAPGGNAALGDRLMRALRRFKTDLRGEGLTTRFIAAGVYGGAVHKDGRIVLALRQFLREVRSSFARLEGVILVGNYPEATLVRSVAWCPGFINPRQLVIGPELVSERADVVLGDLSGHWETLYRQADFTLEGLSALPDAATEAQGWFDGESIRDGLFTSDAYTTSSSTYRDAFFLDDALYTVQRRTPQRLEVQLQRAERNAEVDSTDRTQPNILARPDIAVSRLNARHVALEPDPSLVGTDGRRFLDANGMPQVVTAPTPLFVGDQRYHLFSHHDFDLERRLLCEYFDRNHRFRVGAFAHLPFRTAAVSGSSDFAPVHYANLLGAAAADFATPVVVPQASLRQYVEFLKTPAPLKYVMAHSDSAVSEFGDDGNLAALTAAVGGEPARWIWQGGQHRPGFEGQGGYADVFVHRAMWQRNAFAGTGASLVVHGGCNVNSTPQTQQETYTSPTYGRWNNAEGFLFYTNCVALLSRAKGFNDSPWGFAEGFRVSDRANVGGAWRAYFNAQASDAGLSTYNIQRKRAYFWSLVGDWSLRLRNRNGLGLVGFDRRFASQAVHPNRAWIDGWNFDAGLNKVRGIGDLDGDGIDEIVVGSEWGIGVLRHDGTSFRALMLAPRDTWFGGWRWDATVNAGRDVIHAVADFTGSNRHEILVWSSWGIATLGLAGGTLTPTRLHGNGTRLGGWLLDTGDNRFAGHGRFAAGQRSQMVITSPWGLGILSLQDGNATYMAPNGTRLGDWLLGTGDNRVRLIADFDGDGQDEILISSPWGMGVLKMVGGTLRSIAMHPRGEDLGGYRIDGDHDFALADTLSGGRRHEIMVADDQGFHVLALVGGRLTRLAGAANGSRIDGWLVGTSVNRLQRCGNLSGDGRADALVRSPWGVGLLTLGADQQLHCHGLVPYGTPLGDWHLEAGDRIAGAGRFTSAGGRRALLFTKP